MILWVYAICKDEKPIIGYFLRHYSTFADKIIIYDGGSTDGTREEISACPKAELREWLGSDAIADDEFTCFANEQWKEAAGQADWIAWLDIDEFLYHPKMIDLLGSYLREGVEVPRIDGYTMMSRRFPTTTGQIYEEIKTGVHDECWAKNAIFRGFMRWNVGRHSMDLRYFTPKMSDRAEIKLLHYRGLGMDYVRARHLRNWNRVPQRCRELGFGANTSPEHSGHHDLNWFSERINGELKEVI